MSSDNNSNGEDGKPASSRILESAGQAVAAENWEDLDRMVAAIDEITPAIMLAQAISAFNLDRKSDAVRICREIIDTTQTSKHLEALSRYYLVSSLERPDYEVELKIWSESAPSELSDLLRDLNAVDLLKVKEVIDFMPPDSETRWLLNYAPSGMKASDAVSCSYCSLNFNDKNALRLHCQTNEHQNVLMSDEGRDWKWRPPPRGHSAESYSLCENFAENQICHYGGQCADAHGNEELNEWKDRLEYRKTRLQRAKEKELYGKSYTEQLLDKWIQASNPDKVMRERVDGVDDSCSSDLVTTVASKTSKCEWVFTLESNKPLKAVALLQDAHRNHFVLTDVTPAVGEGFSGRNEQEWVAPSSEESETALVHTVKVAFSTDIFGTFRQSIVFDFGAEPVLVKHICVDVIPVSDADKIQEIKKEIVYSAAERWDDENSEILHFSQLLAPHLQPPSYLVDLVKEKELLERYPCPRASTFVLTQTTITEKKLTKNNYRSRMHELLYVEEIARYEQIARYNLTSTLKITNNYLLTPSGMATSTAKYSHSGELFACLPLSKDVSEDTSAGRLILNNCTSVFMSAKDGTTGKKRKVYEAVIEDKGKNVIYLKVSAPAVTGLGLKAETDFVCDVQFQPSRLSYSEWHQAIDKIADFKIIFPETNIEPSIPWTPQRQWDTSLDPRLNAKQREAIMAITSPIKTQLPPILLIGPFGTGKTYTLAQALKQLVHQSDAKVLICTHSNSAADLYIKDYLHPWVEDGLEAAKPLRVYYHKRWVATVNTIVQKYCLIDSNGAMRSFRRPTAEDIMQHRIIVVTLNSITALELPKGYFTHILLDEAAQAMECEAIMPLALANESTRIVLAGDHMQMSPEIFSNFAKERKLHVSLLERLYDHYPSDFPCKILLCENYRAHEAIIKFTSELFYEQKLVASGKIPRHDKFYPLTFFTTRGEDVQDRNSTTFYNNSEVYEVVERVSELRKKWPSSWGKISDQSIGIMTPYADQVFRIRSELRKRRMAGISVERVLNVQGKQFRAIFLSTVRTRRTCSNSANSNKEEEVDYGFLSNSKLLNTAITRAQSLVAVVGDPVALCSIGKCRKVWERFIDICNQNKSLFGITWSLLRSQLDGVELKKTYVLNPNAPEFIPRALMHEAYLRGQTDLYNQHSHGGHHGTQYHGHHSNYHQPHHGPAHNYRQSSGMMNPHIPRAIEPQHPMPPQQYQNGPQHHNIPPSAQHPAAQGQQFPYQNPQQMYFSGAQSGHQMMRGPPPPLQNNNHNLWGPSFPLVPSPGRNTPPGWRGPKPSYMNQPPGVRPPNLNHQRQQIPPPPSAGQQPLRSPGAATGASQHMQIPYTMQKQQAPQQMQFPPNTLRTTAAAAPQMSPAAFSQTLPHTYNEQPHYHQMSQEILNRNVPNMMPHNMVQQQVQQQQQQQQTQQVPPKIYQERSHQGEKEYQFLQNVHFPEKSSPAAGTAARSCNPQSDWSYLLPPGMSFYDMAIEPKENQIKWFMRLMETQGLEAANKFTEILRQVPTATPVQNVAQPKTVPTASDPFDLFLDDLIKSPTAAQPLLKDILGYSSAPSSSGVSSQMSNGYMGPSSTSKSSLDSELFGPKPGEHQSVPLYRRQAGQSYSGNASVSSKNHSSVASATPPDLMDQQSLLDFEKMSQNFPAALFGANFGDQNGFAQGLPSIQTLAANLQQQNNFNQHQENQLRHFAAQHHMYNYQHQPQRDPVDELMRQNPSSATYASVLSGAGGMQNQSKQLGNNKEMDPKDPFVSHLCASLGKSNGYYNYFQ